MLNWSTEHLISCIPRCGAHLGPLWDRVGSKDLYGSTSMPYFSPSHHLIPNPSSGDNFKEFLKYPFYCVLHPTLIPFKWVSNHVERGVTLLTCRIWNAHRHLMQSICNWAQRTILKFSVFHFKRKNPKKRTLFWIFFFFFSFPDSWKGICESIPNYITVSIHHSQLAFLAQW